MVAFFLSSASNQGKPRGQVASRMGFGPGWLEKVARENVLQGGAAITMSTFFAAICARMSAWKGPLARSSSSLRRMSTSHNSSFIELSGHALLNSCSDRRVWQPTSA